MTTTIQSALRSGKTLTAIAALLVASTSFGANMSMPEYSAAKERIEAQHKADRGACDKFSGNTKDVCVLEADGKQKVAKAEIEFGYSGKPKDANQIAITKADATYAVAKETCDDKGGNAKDVCVSEAKAAHTRAMIDAKLREKVTEARKDAAQDKNDADYKVAAEKCESLAGDAKASCLSAAKALFNKS